MQKGNSYTVGQWCDRWFHENQSRWRSTTCAAYTKKRAGILPPCVCHFPTV